MKEAIAIAIGVAGIIVAVALLLKNYRNQIKK